MKPTTRLSLYNLATFLPALLGYFATVSPAFNWLTKHAPTACTKVEQFGFLPCQAMLGFWAVFIGAAAKFGIDYAAIIRPLAQIDRSRKLFSDRELVPILESFVETYGKGAGSAGEDLDRCARLSLMLVRRSWRSLFFRALHVRWTCGFDEHDRDASLVLWLEQGVAGKALRLKRPLAQETTKAEMVRFLFKDRPWGLLSWQASRASRVLWVLAVPIYSTGASEKNRDRVDGVITLDVTDRAVANKIAPLPITTPVLSAVCEGFATKAYLAASLW